MQALDSLRTKGLVMFADSLGSRVTKFRHNAREALGVGDNELVVLVELLLRGPQTASELRVRASRMRPLESVDVVQEALRTLIDRPEPLVQRLPGGRAERFAQLICPTLHPLEDPDSEPAQTSGGSESRSAGASDRLARLEAEVTDLRQIVERLARELGVTDILKPPGG